MLNDDWQSDNVDARRRACLAGRTRVEDRMAVLLVEHDTDVAHQLIESFAGQPVELLHCPDAATGLLYIGRSCPDVVVIGPMPTGLSAVEFLTVVQRFDEHLPIIVGAGAGSGELAAEATELGAVAVVRRPYPAARLLALLRSVAPDPAEVELRPLAIDLGRLRVDGAVPQCWLDGQLVPLPPQEFILLRYFAERPGAVLTRKELNRAVWGDKLGVQSNSLTVHVARLRKRLGDDDHDPRWIKAIRGLGYQFTVPDPGPTSDVPSQATPSPRSPDVHTV
jgi:DNA-binding response OmpR family regulator